MTAELSIVVPVYGCAKSLGPLYQRVAAVIEGLAVEAELVFVDDRSVDDAWPQLVALAREDARVKAYRLSRNFGQHAAITAGLAQSTGRWSVVMDCDLQDVPEEIPTLVEKTREGYDIVFARRKGRRDPWTRRLAARVYFGLMNLVLRTDLDGQFGSFSIISANVRAAFLQVGDRRRQYLLILHWLGFRHTAVDVRHAERHSSRSSYGFGRLIEHALDGVFFQTTALLRWIVYLGFVVAIAGGGLAALVIGLALTGSPPAGWASLAVLILVIGGFIITSTGVTGLYIGNIFDQVKDRPLYVIDRSVVDRVER